MKRLRSRIIGVAIVSACGFTASVRNQDDPDGGVIPDAGPCQNLGNTCAGSELRRCTMVGKVPDVEQCHWGCIEDDAPHCGVANPGGVLLPSDLVDNPMLMSKTISGDFNTDNGEIQNGGRGSGTGIISGIEFTVRNNVGVFRFRNLTLNGTIAMTGSNAVAIVALGTITINGTVDLTGGCSGTQAGPGGFRGGNAGQDGLGPGGGKAGQGGSNQCSAGGGGSYGTLGGSGGSSNGENVNPAPGVITMNPLVSMLVGGGGGGGGGGSGSERGTGGGGGGAIQLFATEGIVVNGTINASGCGGNRGGEASCGGGAGAGGAILVEGKVLTLGSNARLAVNGGGGGGANDGGGGSDGSASKSRASGGSGSGGNSGSGGSGGADAGLAGIKGTDASQTPGGGGGGVGWMRFNTLSGQGMYMTGAICSPDFPSQSTTSEGKIDVR